MRKNIVKQILRTRYQNTCSSHTVDIDEDCAVISLRDLDELQAETKNFQIDKGEFWQDQCNKLCEKNESLIKQLKEAEERISESTPKNEPEKAECSTKECEHSFEGELPRKITYPISYTGLIYRFFLKCKKCGFMKEISPKNEPEKAECDTKEELNRIRCRLDIIEATIGVWHLMK